MYLSRGDCPQRVLKLVRYPATRFLGEPPTGVKFNIVCVYVYVFILYERLILVRESSKDYCLRSRPDFSASFPTSPPYHPAFVPSNDGESLNTLGMRVSRTLRTCSDDKKYNFKSNLPPHRLRPLPSFDGGPKD